MFRSLPRERGFPRAGTKRPATKITTEGNTAFARYYERLAAVEGLGITRKEALRYLNTNSAAGARANVKLAPHPE